MKKFRLILCAIICVLGLTACGNEADNSIPDVTVGELQNRTIQIFEGAIIQLPDESIEEIIDYYGAEGLEEEFEAIGIYAQGNGIVSALTSWNTGKKDLGEYVRVTGSDVRRADQGSEIIVTLDIECTNRNGQIEAIYLDDFHQTLKSLTTNVNWTFGEKMEKAGLNTLLGMGTVFVILILISLIISLFGFIPKIQEALTKKDKVEETKTVAVDNTIAQIVEKEELTDDLELVAVITAAIAASGTSGSTDGFVVRSIRRRPNSQWNKA